MYPLPCVLLDRDDECVETGRNLAVSFWEKMPISILSEAR